MPRTRAATRPQGAILKLELACDLAESRRAALAIREFLTAQRCREDDVVDCELALVEACNNAIEYVSPSRAKQPVLVEVECRLAQIRLSVIDHTPGFDWPAEVSLPGPEKECGRGLFIINSVMDYIEYKRSPGKNVLVLRRNRIN